MCVCARRTAEEGAEVGEEGGANDNVSHKERKSAERKRKGEGKSGNLREKKRERGEGLKDVKNRKIKKKCVK